MAETHPDEAILILGTPPNATVTPPTPTTTHSQGKGNSRASSTSNETTLRLTISSMPPEGQVLSETGSIAPGKLLMRPLRYSCLECGKCYLRPSLLEQHKRTHLGERPFACNQCDKRFLRKSHLMAHMILHAENTAKPFHCLVCGKGVNSAQHLKRHEVTHTKSFNCDKCDELFYRHQLLRHHILLVHDKVLRCEKCDRTFSRPNRLAQHNLKYHGSAPAYQCDSPGCFRNFKTWLALQLHIKLDHPKLACTICGKKCVGQRGLANHMLLHDDATTIKIWKCTYCSGLFGKKAELISHYDEYHDGNAPLDLIRREQFEEPSYDNKQGLTVRALAGVPLAVPVHSNISEDSASVAITTEANSTSLCKHFAKKISYGQLVAEIMRFNYPSQRIPCPRTKCQRDFSREQDLRRHLRWHDTQLQRIQAFLSSLDTLDEKINLSPIHLPGKEPLQKRMKIQFETEEEIDDELDSMIDHELRLLTAGSTNGEHLQ